MSIHQETQPTYSRWLTEEVYKLVDMVRSDEAIYNPRHKYYFCRPYVENFWHEVDLRLRKNPGSSLAKWTNLRISFRREYTNYQEEKVPPCWTYFDKMFFLHPYLRNKKQSGSAPKDVDSHLQEALAQLTNIHYKPHHNANVSPVNDYMDTYLSYCDDDPHTSSGPDDIIEEDDENTNTIQNDIKSECESENENKANHHNEGYKDVIVDISDDPPLCTTSSKRDRDNTHSEIVNRSLLKRCRTEPGDHSSGIPTTSNISLVRPLAMTPIIVDPNPLHNSLISSSHASSSHVNSSHHSPTMRITSASGSPARRNELCQCKSDSDAMFLMSLLPDIQKLHGRDRGKIKIAFQNILQEFLYPD